MPPAIRPATAADATRLAELRWEFRSALRAPHESRKAFLQRCASWMRERLDHDPCWRCWVAEQGAGSRREILGQLWLYVIDKVPNPVAEREHHAYITNVYVVPAARGAGLGGTLLATAIDWCRQSRMHCVILWPTDASRTLYARHNFAVRDDIMELVLD